MSEFIENALGWLGTLLYLLMVCAVLFGVPLATIWIVIHFALKYW